MAKKKYKSNGRGKRSQPAKRSVDIMPIGLILLSVLLAVLIYTKSGTIGNKLYETLGGMLGFMEYILPVGTFILGVKIACEGRDTLTSKLALYLIMLISVAVVFSVFQISFNELDTNKELSEVAKDAYEIGMLAKGGGALGAIVAVPLVNLLGVMGAIILCLGIAILLVILTFGINTSDIISSNIDKMKERREERQRYRMEMAEDEYDIEPKAMKAKASNQRVKAQKAVPRNKTKAKKIFEQINEDPQNEDMMEEQIKINFGGQPVESLSKNQLESGKPSKTEKSDKKAKSKNLEKEEIQPDYIEANLFSTVEKEKENNTKEVLQLEHMITVEDENYECPPLNILSKGNQKQLKGGAKIVTNTASKLQKTLYSFGVSAKVENASVGPAITRYELKPAEGVRVSKIANLADDIALNLAAETIRIEAPIPGKQAVGIEVPNKERQAVHLRDVLESNEFQNCKSETAVALGKDVAGETEIADIAKMPHVLIAGATGAGKSVCINTIITSIIYKSKPSEVKFVMIDPKVVELSVYNGIPHLLIPVVTDPRKAAGALAWAVQEMENRYSLFAQKGVRDLKGYNKIVEKKEEGRGKLPKIVIIIDELADLMMVAKNDVEDAICRLAQKARAAGMHLVIATQRPSVDVITGIIKANVPSRIAFTVSSQIDSRTILDSIGAEKLLGKGDMLFFPAGAPKPSRIQGAFVSDEEVEKIVDFLKSNGEATYSEDIIESIENSGKTDKELAQEQAQEDDADALLPEAIETVVETGQASTSFIQRRFKVGYARAGRIIDQMEERGIISGYQGSKPRQVLMTLDKLNELKMSTEPKQEEG